MPKYIDADDFYVSQVARCWADPLVGDGTGSSARLYDELQKQPAADVQETKRGEWHLVSNKPCCSICGNPTMEIPPKKYCPHCGAKMEEGK